MEGEVQHASAREFRALLQGAGFTQMTQTVFGGPAPFLLTEGVAKSGTTAVVRPWAGIAVTTRTGVMSQ